VERQPLFIKHLQLLGAGAFFSLPFFIFLLVSLNKAWKHCLAGSPPAGLYAGFIFSCYSRPGACLQAEKIGCQYQ
jgi:hypothetical protein